MTTRTLSALSSAPPTRRGGAPRPGPLATLGFVLVTLSASSSPLSAQDGRGSYGPERLPYVSAPEGMVWAPITERYRARGVRRWLLGSGYRDVWQTPLPIEVLDVRGTGSGLVPVETGGNGQTVSLEFVGGDGLEYAVRSVDKDPTRQLDSYLRGTVVADVVQDQVSQYLPTAGLVVDPLLDATGILHPRHALVVVPDADELGEYRDEFRGLVGMFTERPQEGADDTPGFAGSTKIVGTNKLLDRLEEGACDEVDDRGYLKARLVDLVIGDRDRHQGQWSWARFPAGDGCWRWKTIPEDRDQAFVRNDGFMMWVYRLFQPQRVPYGPEYPDLGGLTFTGWEVDRAILAELDEPVWIEVAEEIRRELTDEVIHSAVARLPDAHEALVGDFLSRSLKARREHLVEQARAYYAMLAAEPDVKATDRDEHAEIEHLTGGDLRLTIRYADDPPAAAPRFERTFQAGVTREVRVYLRGGDDVTTVSGRSARIDVRVVGGGGDDRFVNRSAAGADRTHFYDDRGDNRVEGSATFDTRTYERPASRQAPLEHALDWGSRSRYLPRVSFDADRGFTAGMSLDRERYGFRAHPTKSEHRLRAAIVSNGPSFLVGWDGRYRKLGLDADLVVEAQYSGLEVLRFYGFGAGTVEGPDATRYEVVQRELTLSPGLEWYAGEAGGERSRILASSRPAVRLGVGALFKYSDTPAEANEGRYIASLDPAPLGFGRFAQAGARAWLEVDTRDDPAYPTSGLRLQAGGEAYPELLDAVDPFGRVEGELSGYLTPGSGRHAPTLAVRLGAARAFGAFPFHEAVFLGGRDDLRGAREQRFAGSGSLFANAEVRVPVLAFDLLLPTELGLHATVETGRVFFADAADAGTPWERGFGGGIWLSILKRRQTLGVTLVQGRERLGLYLGGGFHF